MAGKYRGNNKVISSGHCGESFSIVECPICHGAFALNTRSIYKTKKDGRTVYYCTYTCWRKAGGD